MQHIFTDISIERSRQKAKHPGETCADLIPMEWKYLILSEEVGEIAKSLNDGDYKNLREELIQVAAVCVAWVESIDIREEMNSA